MIFVAINYYSCVYIIYLQLTTRLMVQSFQYSNQLLIHMIFLWILDRHCSDINIYMILIIVDMMIYIFAWMHIWHISNDENDAFYLFHRHCNYKNVLLLFVSMVYIFLLILEFDLCCVIHHRFPRVVWKPFKFVVIVFHIVFVWKNWQSVAWSVLTILIL